MCRLALPYLLEPAEFSSSSGPPRVSNRIGTFADVARDYLSDIQLVDSVKFDESTGRAWFLLYNSVMSNTKEGWVILLDATRGLQAVSSPLSVAELRRCAL
ncbi:hypothetical protein AK812_SmicGene7543 [Symbiodinium microadriaticum]|uniref:Uncharacterized protein n=1 Tax=Symbiodinium microadriaticum TaxID=2951 RepID=A0A1Q9ENC6_SYMMI|nr:hypothetical protein AK812_SmicGene7543 [Symbiodinium microadriaticum]